MQALPLCGLGLLSIFWVWWSLSIWMHTGLFYLLGVDWGMFWAAAHSFRVAGPTSIYDLNHLANFVRPLGNYYGSGAKILKVNPVPYPPLFVLLVMPFSLVGPGVGFVLWTVANSAAAGWVSAKLARRVGLPGWLVIPMVLLSVPLGDGLLVGQPVGLLLLAFYQLYVELENGREVRAGVWGGILLLKPQYAIVLLLVFVLKRRFSVLAGFTVTASVLGLTSLMFLGPAGILDLIHSMTGYASGFRATSIRMAPQEMISWRGLLAAVLPIVPDRVGILATIALSLATLMAIPFIWRGRWDPSSEQFHMRMLGTMIVTMLVGFDVHIHGAVLLIVPLMLASFGSLSHGQLRKTTVLAAYALPFLAMALVLVWARPFMVCVAVLFMCFQLASLWFVLSTEYRSHAAPANQASSLPLAA